MVTYDIDLPDAHIAILEKEYPWFKDLDATDIYFKFTPDFSIRISSGSITKGTIPETNMIFESCTINGLSGTRMLTKDSTLSTAKSGCNVNIEGGSFVDLNRLSGSVISSGKFLTGMQITNCVILNDSKHKPKFTAEYDNRPVTLRSCVIDKVDSDMVDAIGVFTSMILDNSTVHNIVYSPTMGKKRLSVSWCDIRKGSMINIGNTGALIADSKVDKFVAMADFAVFNNCEIHNSKLTSATLTGMRTTVINTKCVACEMNLLMPDSTIPKTVFFINSSWDGGTFRGVFNYDSTWISGKWFKALSGKKGGAMFGWTATSTTTLTNGDVKTTDTVNAIPSLYSPKGNQELFDLMKKLSIAHTKLLQIDNNGLPGDVEGARIVLREFRKLCGVYDDKEVNYPISLGELYAMDDLTDDDRNIIKDAMERLV